MSVESDNGANFFYLETTPYKLAHKMLGILKPMNKNKTVYYVDEKEEMEASYEKD